MIKTKNKRFLSRALSAGIALALACDMFPMQSLRAQEAAAVKEEGQEGESGQESGEEAQEEIAREVIEIHTAGEFLAFADNCFLDSWSANKDVFLCEDLDLSDAEFGAVPVFAGHFDGQGHTISGFSYSGDGYVAGLFRYIEKGGVVENLKLKGEVIAADEKECIGGLCGVNYGTIRRCTFQGTVSGRTTVGGLVGVNEGIGVVQNSFSGGRVTGYYATGGMVGRNHGLISYCTNRSCVNNDNEWVEEDDEMGMGLFLSINVSGSGTDLFSGVDTGGVAGYSDGTVIRCMNYGQIGYEHTGYNIGGIVGRQSGVLSSCTNNGTVYGRKDVGGIVGQMEPYIEVDEAESLRNAVNKLHDLIAKTIDDMQAGKNVIKGDLDQLAAYSEGATDAGDALAGQMTDFVDTNMDQVQSMAERLGHVMEMLPDIFDDVYDAEDSFADANRALMRIMEDLKDAGNIEGEYVETDYNRLSLLSTVGGNILSLQHYPQAGETVNIVAEPNDGYGLQEIRVIDAYGGGVEVQQESGRAYTFIMPEPNVRVEAYFGYEGGEGDDSGDGGDGDDADGQPGEGTDKDGAGDGNGTDKDGIGDGTDKDGTGNGIPGSPVLPDGLDGNGDGAGSGNGGGDGPGAGNGSEGTGVADPDSGAGGGSATPGNGAGDSGTGSGNPGGSTGGNGGSADISGDPAGSGTGTSGGAGGNTSEGGVDGAGGSGSAGGSDGDASGSTGGSGTDTPGSGEGNGADTLGSAGGDNAGNSGSTGGNDADNPGGAAEGSADVPGSGDGNGSSAGTDNSGGAAGNASGGAQDGGSNEADNVPGVGEDASGGDAQDGTNASSVQPDSPSGGSGEAGGADGGDKEQASAGRQAVRMDRFWYTPARLLSAGIRVTERKALVSSAGLPESGAQPGDTDGTGSAGGPGSTDGSESTGGPGSTDNAGSTGGTDGSESTGGPGTTDGPEEGGGPAKTVVCLSSNLSGNAFSEVNGGTATVTVIPDGAYAVDGTPSVSAGGREVPVTKAGESVFTFPVDGGTYRVHISFRKLDKSQTVNSAKGDISSAIREQQAATEKVNAIIQQIQGSQEVTPEQLEELTKALGEMSGATSAVLSNLGAVSNVVGQHVLERMEAAGSDMTAALDHLQDAVDSVREATRDARSIVDYVNGQPNLHFSKLGGAFDTDRERLHEQLKGMSDSIMSLSSNAAGYSDVVNDDLRAVNDQINVVFNLLADNLTNYGEISVEELYEDADIEDVDSITTGKTNNCRNKGVVEGDINVGGIAGAMSIDEEDPEDSAAGSVDYQIGRRYFTKCIITDSVNEGYVLAKKDGAGGIVGYMRHGIVVDSEGYGSVESTEGDFVGGICGESLTVIRDCYALCSVSGGRYVGGIAGFADTVKNCYAMADCNAAMGRKGAIAGQTASYEDALAGEAKEEAKVSGNYYVGDDICGIDSISYVGVAEPMKYEELLAVVNLPTQFRHLKVIYRVDNIYLGEQEVKFGESLSGLDYPVIPAKAGYYGVWPDYSGRVMAGNLLVKGEYKEDVTVVESSGKLALEAEGEREKPYALVEQRFTQDTVLHADLSDMEPPEKAIHREHIVYSVALENARIGSGDTFAIRLYNPYEDAEVWGLKDGVWTELESKARGQYLQVDMTGPEQAFCVAEEKSGTWAVITGVAAGLAAAGILAALMRKWKAGRRRGKMPE